MKNRQITFSIDNVVYGFILISTIAFTTNLNYENKSVFVVLTFYIIGFISFFSIVFSKKNISVFRTAHIFNYIFFFLAPLHQYLTIGGISLWRVNGASIYYSDSLYEKSNIIIIIGLIIFNIFYYFGKKNNILIKNNNFYFKKTSNSYLCSKSKTALLIISTLSVLYLVLTKNLTLLNTQTTGDNLLAQVTNIVRYFSVCSTIIFLKEYKNNFSLLLREKIFIIIFLEVLLIFSPFWGNMARFILYGTYVVLLSAIFSNSKYKSLYFLLYFVGFSLDFSALKNLKDLSLFLNVKVDFNHFDYDAYQILMSIVSYTDNVEKAYGLNIFSALMFIIPRSIWNGKMEATGGIVMSYYGSWFKNVSAPYIGELYFAFGWMGVILGSIVTARIVKIVDSWDESIQFFKNVSFCILSGMTIYIMRGSLLPTVSFTLGLFLSMIFVCFLVQFSNRIRYKIYDRYKIG